MVKILSDLKVAGDCIVVKVNDYCTSKTQSINIMLRGTGKKWQYFKEGREAKKEDGQN